MKEPSPSDAARCIEIRKRCKSGLQVHPEDMEFVESMYRKYPEWYSKQSERIFVETAPFGSIQSMRDIDD